MRGSIHLIACVVGAVVLGCAGAAPRPSSPPPSSSPSPASPTTPARAQMALPAELTAPHGMIVLGDQHGTRELPAFVGQLVGQLAGRQPVVLALEIPEDTGRLLAAYVASDGGAAARDAALRDAWWQAPYQDGRRSVAMFALIESVRALRAGGARVDLVCFDPDLPPGGSPEDREEGMARHLIALRRARPDAIIVAFVGNLHARKAAHPAFANRTWVGMRLASAGVAFVSLNPRLSEGSAWNCIDSDAGHCGPRLTGSGGDERGVHLERTQDGAFDGWFGVGPVTASPPAAFPALAADLDAKLRALRDGPEGRRRRALHAYKDKQYARCVAEIDAIATPTANDAYTQACCLALAGDKDAAFAHLRLALERGFADLKAAEADPDLASLHDDPRWPPRAR